MAYPDASRVVRLGVRLDWALGENLYRGDNEYLPGLLRSLYLIEKQHLFNETDFQQPPPRNYFPPNYPINNWLGNGKKFPMPNEQIRTIENTDVVVIDPVVVPPVPFPDEKPDPEDEDAEYPDPDVFSTQVIEGKWVYDENTWEVLGFVYSNMAPAPGEWKYVTVDDRWVGFDGLSWRQGPRGRPIRNIEISGHYPKPLIGGTVFIYCAVQAFVVPARMLGSLASAQAKGPTTMNIKRNNATFGTVTFLPAADDVGRPIFSSGADVVFAPGDRLSVVAENDTNGIKDVAISIRGILP